VEEGGGVIFLGLKVITLLFAMAGRKMCVAKVTCHTAGDAYCKIFTRGKSTGIVADQFTRLEYGNGTNIIKLTAQQHFPRNSLLS
jgi:hypothetical protein